MLNQIGLNVLGVNVRWFAMSPLDGCMNDINIELEPPRSAMAGSKHLLALLLSDSRLTFLGVISWQG